MKFIALIPFIIFSASLFASPSGIFVIDVDDTEFKSKLVENEKYYSVLAMGRQVEVKVKVADVEYKKIGGDMYLNFVIHVDSNKSDFTYNSLFEGLVKLEDIDISWSASKFNISDGEVMDILPSQSFGLRNDLDKEFSDKVIVPYIKGILLNTRFSIEKKEMRKLRSTGKYTLDYSSEDIFIAL